jgi:hypothetical protein
LWHYRLTFIAITTGDAVPGIVIGLSGNQKIVNEQYEMSFPKILECRCK